MKKEETKSLVINKLKEGKDFPQIDKEIKTLKQSQIILKNNKTEIRQLKKQIEKLIEENNKLKKRIFNLGLKAQPIREDKDTKIATINHLNRIYRMLKLENKPLSQTEIRNLCCVLNETARGCLNFLEKNNMVKKIKMGGGVDKYEANRFYRGAEESH